jgi:hypothetical protein
MGGTLGIWIPTWNRPNFFNRLTETIAPQLDPRVTVACGLNPPNEGYRIPYWMKATRNPTNIGQSLNILLGVNELGTDYLWVLGDDEQLKPEGITEILELIDTNPGMIICTDGRFDHGPEGSYKTWVEWADACVQSDRGVMLTAQTLISVTVFKRKALNMSTSYSYLDSKYGHHFGILDGLIHEPVTVTRKPVFTAGNNRDSHIHDEKPEVKENHKAICQQSLTELIAFINHKAARNYATSDCYQPGVGYDT